MTGDICVVARILLEACRDLDKVVDRLLEIDGYAEPGSHPRKLGYEMRARIGEVLRLCKDEQVLYPYKKILEMCRRREEGWQG